LETEETGSQENYRLPGDLKAQIEAFVTLRHGTTPGNDEC
jgi:hypothetical protein